MTTTPQTVPIEYLQRPLTVLRVQLGDPLSPDYKLVQTMVKSIAGYLPHRGIRLTKDSNPKKAEPEIQFGPCEFRGVAEIAAFTSAVRRLCSFVDPLHTGLENW